MQLLQHTAAIEAAVTRTRGYRDAAHEALMAVAGGPKGIVSEQDIHTRRAAALAEDTDTLRAARAEARALDNQLVRAEAAAARAFAHRTAEDTDLAEELPTRAAGELREAARIRTERGWEPDTGLGS
jgi:hypothetical protein